MASRMFRVPYTGTVTAAGGNTDLLEATPGDDKPIRLAGWCIGQITEVKDAEEEALRITVRHMTATITTGDGTSVTPVGIGSGEAAAAFSAECNGPGVATTSGTNEIKEELAWINRNTPWERWFDEPWQIKARQGEGIFVRLETTLADNMDVAMTFYIIED